MQWKRSGTLGDGDARTGREVVRRRAQAARQRQRWLVSGAVSGGPRRDDDGDGAVMMTAATTRGTAQSDGDGNRTARGGSGREGAAGRAAWRRRRVRGVWQGEG